jgi:hypothetical protein
LARPVSALSLLEAAVHTVPSSPRDLVCGSEKKQYVEWKLKEVTESDTIAACEKIVSAGEGGGLEAEKGRVVHIGGWDDVVEIAAGETETGEWKEIIGGGVDVEVGDDMELKLRWQAQKRWQSLWCAVRHDVLVWVGLTCGVGWKEKQRVCEKMCISTTKLKHFSEIRAWHKLTLVCESFTALDHSMFVWK